MNQNISQRFHKFIMYKCRTIGTNGKFIGPEWALLAINKVLLSNNMSTDNSPLPADYRVHGEDVHIVLEK